MIFTSIFIMLICIFKNGNSFVLPTSVKDLDKQNDSYGNYIKAVLQSSGYLQQNTNFLNTYYDNLYDYHPDERHDYYNNYIPDYINEKDNETTSCRCEGCYVNGECIECLNKIVCKKVMGEYCE